MVTRTSFKRGHAKRAGRKKGTPNRLTAEVRQVTAEVREVARALVEDPEYRKSLRRRLIKGQAGQMEVLLHYYAYGRPTARVELTGDAMIPLEALRQIHAAVEARRRAGSDADAS